jgi:hypothetical protein
MFRIKIGRWFEVEVGGGLYLRAPLFGAIFYNRRMGLTWDSWREIQALEVAERERRRKLMR